MHPFLSQLVSSTKVVHKHILTLDTTKAIHKHNLTLDTRTEKNLLISPQNLS